MLDLYFCNFLLVAMSKGMVYAVVLNHHNNDLKKNTHTQRVWLDLQWAIHMFVRCDMSPEAEQIVHGMVFRYGEGE